MSEAAAKTTGKESGARPGRLRFILMLLVSVLALGGGLIAAVGPSRLAELAGLGGAVDEAAPETPAEPSTEEMRAALAADPGRMALPLEEIIVNITATTATGRQTSRFLKLDLALIYDAAAPDAARLAEREIYMRDSFQDYLRTLDERDLRGSLGLAELKSELLRRARAISGGEAPREILISDMIVQ
ncbi:flagellar basal body-associated FliL family protein [Limimaricola variabilis]|uniref:flagellar basal body-associated FliL family protein n=1 Tax=Limimaricola variabilis TaxID=1492771 RepID=UPI002AC95697|nr:flagellar basal body-associated FliL family protein [Limimaricola variabilis]WPY94921.1 flagellar basal body-associated FliL family protein [Limimaricola variabilis]